MTKPIRVAVLVGSLRRESYTRRVAEAAIRVAPDGASFVPVEIDDLALYNQDLERPEAVPPAWRTFREAVSACDAVLFFTPEYNRSIPGVLKNAIDVGSRPPGQSVWNAKPAAVISVSPGALGGFGANQHLRQCLVSLNMPTLQQPEAYIGGVAKLLAEDGGFSTQNTSTFMGELMARFLDWAERTRL